jgi:hypothetical protein
MAKETPAISASDSTAISEVDSTVISTTVKSALDPLANQPGTAAHSTTVTLSRATRNFDYPVADLVGRCFLRVCFWIEICTSWTKKYHQPNFTGEPANARPMQVKVPSALMAAPTIQVQSTAPSASRTIS